MIPPSLIPDISNLYHLSHFLAELCQRFDHFNGLHKNHLLVLLSKSVLFPVTLVFALMLGNYVHALLFISI